MSGFFNSITELIERLWNDSSFGWIFAIAMVFVIVVVATGILWLVFELLVGTVNWFIWLINRRHCTHCGNWTTDISLGNYATCPKGQFCCSSCTFQHKMDNEPHVNCPECGLMMEKRNIRNKLVIDVCTKHGVWLDLDELETLEGDARQNGYSVGHSNGLAVGIIIS